MRFRMNAGKICIIFVILSIIEYNSVEKREVQFLYIGMVFIDITNNETKNSAIPIGVFGLFSFLPQDATAA